MTARSPLGKLLVDAGLVSQEALDAALREQARDGRRLGRILVARGLVSDTQVTQILSHQLALPWVSLAKVDVDPALLEKIPRALAERHGIVPVYLRRDAGRAVLYVATDDPTDEIALRECAEVARMDVRPMVAATDDLRAAIAAWYGGSARPHPKSYAPSGAMRVAASIAPPASVVKPPPLPPPRAPAVELDDDDVVPHVSEPPDAPARQIVFVVGARGPFLRKCRLAAETIAARVEKSDLLGAATGARELRPFAIVVPEEIYAFDRLGLSKLAIEVDALLVIWSDDLEPEYLEPLLVTAQKRRG